MGMRFISPSEMLIIAITLRNGRMPSSAARRATSAIMIGPPITSLEMSPVTILTMPSAIPRVASQVATMPRSTASPTGKRTVM